MLCYVITLRVLRLPLLVSTSVAAPLELVAAAAICYKCCRGSQQHSQSVSMEHNLRPNK